MPEAPQITTIIPTFQRPKLLERAIASAISQTYHHIQVWVYDNASSYETREVVEEWQRKDPRVYYHRHDENIGSIRNFEYGLLHVATPFFSFLSDDDFLLPWFYEKAMTALIQYPTAAFYAGATLIFEKNIMTDCTGQAISKEGFFLALSENDILPDNAWTSSLYRKSASDESGGLDISFRTFDVDFIFRFCSKYAFVVSKTPCAAYCVHPESSFVQFEPNEFYFDLQKMIRKFRDDPVIEPQMKLLISKNLTQLLEKTLFGMGIKAIENRRFSVAKNAAKLLLSRLNKKGFLLVLITVLSSRLHIFHRLVVIVLTLHKSMRFSQRQSIIKKQEWYPLVKGYLSQKLSSANNK